MKVIATEKAPGAIGPYSQGFLTNGFVYTSGQIPVNPADGTIPEGIAAQAEQSCKNVGAILEAGGSGGQDHLLPGRHRGFCGLQRGLRQVLHLQARPQLCRRQGPAQGRPVRGRGHRRGVIRRPYPVPGAA